MNMGYQNRACLRIPTNFEALIANPEGGTLPVKINNMSVTGFQLLCGILFKKEDILIIQITLPKTAAVFELQLKVLRTRNLAENKQEIGVQIMNSSEEWIQYAGRWIESSFEKNLERKTAAILLCVPAVVLAIKAALIALGLQTLEIPLNEFLGLEILGVPLFASIFPAFTLFAACVMFYCARAILSPAVRTGFFFTSTAAIAGMLFLSVRLLLKLSLLQHAADEKLIYLFDLIICIPGGVGAFMARTLEDHHRRYEHLVSRESIYPPAQPPSAAQNT